MRKLKVLIVFVFVMSLASYTSAGTYTVIKRIKVPDSAITGNEFPFGLFPHIHFSHDGTKVAYLATIRHNGKFERAIYIDGEKIWQPSDEQDFFGAFGFNHNGNKVAHVSRRKVNGNIKYTLRINREVFSTRENIAIGSHPVFSQDGKDIAYVIINNSERMSLWINNMKMTDDFQRISALCIVHGGSKFIYAAKKGGKFAVWSNYKKISGDFDSIGHCEMTKDGEKIGYIVKSGEKYSVWVNRQKVTPEFSGMILRVSINRDGTKVGYAVDQEGRMPSTILVMTTQK